jgi:hypothetical protein
MGDFTYMSVIRKVYWEVEMDGAHVDGQQIVNTTSAIIDSGTTLIIGDSESVKAAYAAIGSAEDSGDGTYTSAFSSLCCTRNGPLMTYYQSTATRNPSSVSNLVAGASTSTRRRLSSPWKTARALEASRTRMPSRSVRLVSYTGHLAYYLSASYSWPMQVSGSSAMCSSRTYMPHSISEKAGLA